MALLKGVFKKFKNMFQTLKFKLNTLLVYSDLGNVDIDINMSTSTSSTVYSSSSGTLLRFFLRLCNPSIEWTNLFDETSKRSGTIAFFVSRGEQKEKAVPCQNLNKYEQTSWRSTPHLIVCLD